MPRHGYREATYLCGNSLGLQPLSAARLLEEELAAWRELAVEAHFRGQRPWRDYHEPFAAPLARLAGAREDEVVCMNGLTVNLHLLMVSFFRPDAHARTSA
jgi:kynureninase